MLTQTDWEIPSYSLFEFKPKETKYCICIPVINEGEKFKKQLMAMGKYASLVDIIILDKGSTDGSTDASFLKKNKVTSLLVLKEKGRQGAQLRMGFAYALTQGYEGVITIDGNGKDGIDAIPDFVRALDEGFDYVQGSRFVKGGVWVNTPLLRAIGIRFLHAPLLSLAARYWYTDTTNGFRAYSAKYLLHPKVKPFRKIFDRYELIFYLTARASQLGLRTKEIPVSRIYPKGEIPTKITGVKGNMDLLFTVLKIIANAYNP